MSIALWGIIIGVVAALILQGLKKLAPKIQDNKVVIRVLVGALACIGAVTSQLTMHGLPIDWTLALTTAMTTLASAEMSYQWLLKYAGSLGQKKG